MIPCLPKKDMIVLLYNLVSSVGLVGLFSHAFSSRKLLSVFMYSSMAYTLAFAGLDVFVIVAMSMQNWSYCYSCLQTSVIWVVLGTCPHGPHVFCFSLSFWRYRIQKYLTNFIFPMCATAVLLSQRKYPESADLDKPFSLFIYYCFFVETMNSLHFWCIFYSRVASADT